MIHKLLWWRPSNSKSNSSTLSQLIEKSKSALAEGRYDVANDNAKTAIRLDSRNVEARVLHGISLLRSGNLRAALEAFSDAYRLAPRDENIHINCAAALEQSGYLEEAELILTRALIHCPNALSLRAARGRILASLERHIEAAADLENVDISGSTDLPTLRAYAYVAFRLHKFCLACDYYFKANEICELDVNGKFQWASCLMYSKKLEHAEKVLNSALAAMPTEATLLKLMAHIHLLQGKWETGFSLYENRLQTMRESGAEESNRSWLGYLDGALGEIPSWKREPLVGKKLLIWMEQGQGDAIMMLRLAIFIKEQCGAQDVTVLSEAPIGRLIEQGGTGLRYIQARTDWKASSGEFDYHCSIMSLPHLLSISVAHIPGRCPYLTTPPELKHLWADITKELKKTRVGIAWAGNPAMRYDALRSISFCLLTPLLTLEGFDFVSLQKGPTAVNEIKNCPTKIHDWMMYCEDFLDTAALIENLDLVITVDTAIAHLAGALGKPVWLLNRYESEWRWMIDQDVSVWYPTMRIFNQAEQNNWRETIERLSCKLAEDGFRNAVCTADKTRAKPH